MELVKNYAIMWYLGDFLDRVNLKKDTLAGNKPTRAQQEAGGTQCGTRN